MKPKSTLRHFLALAGSSVLATTAAQALPGTWNANSNGDWNTSGNWDSGTVAAGAGSLATLGDFIDADRTINLDIAPIIGGITAADSTHNYTISGANTLTLDSTGSSAVNVITAGRTLTIASMLSGSDGITKSGAGTLALSNANSISGTFALTAGTLQLGNATSMGTSSLTMTSGTTLQLRNDADTIFTAPINTAPATGVTYNIDVNQATGAGANKKLSLGNITFATSSSGSITNTINVTGGNGYTLGLGTISAPSGGGAAHPVVINATTAAVEIAKFSAGSFGHVLQLQGGNSITLGNFEMGSNGNNSLTVSGSGTVVTLGTTTQTNNRSGGSAAYTLNSGTLNLTTTSSLANVRAVSGTLSRATFTINGGTLNNTSGSALTLDASPASGTVSGSPSITIGGDFAFGTGSSTSANNLNLGNGAITNAGNRTITFNGTGTTLTMGGVMTNTSGANQTTTVNGAGNTLSLGGYTLGNGFTNVINGTGNVTITGAITHTGGTSGLTYSGSGTLTIAGVNNYIGATTINSGTLAISSTGRLYNGSTSALTTVNTGGTLQVYAWQYGADGSIGTPFFGTGTLAVNGGTIRYTGVGENSGNNNGRVFAIGTGGATLEAAGSGTWFITRNASSPADQTTVNGLTLTGSGNGNHSNNLVGTAGTVTKSGSGTWTLSGTNTYTGATTVSAGTLLINGSTSTSSAVTVGASGTLGGSGTVGGSVTVDGVLAPGNSTGLLSVGSLALNASSSTNLEINGTNRGAVSDGYDALGVNTGGSIDLGGALIFEFGNLSAFAANTEFDLFSFTTTSTGDFSGVTSTGFYTGTWNKTGDIWALTDEGQTLNFSEATGNLTVIPEPSAALLGGLGLMFLLRRRR